MHTDDLVATLSYHLRPVRRVSHPLISVLCWTCLAASVIGAAVLILGPRPDLMQRLDSGFDLPQLIAAGTAGLLAALAAFHLALPDRNPRWAVVPVPATIVWLIALASGIQDDLTQNRVAALDIHQSLTCLAFIAGFGVPLSLGVLWFLRYAALMRGGLVASLAGLSAAAYASVGLSMVHPLETALMVLVWHGISIAVVVAFVALIGPCLMQFCMKLAGVAQAGR